MKREIYTLGLRRGGGAGACYSQFIYFDKDYEKYLSVSNFWEFEEELHGRNRNSRLRYVPAIITVHINKDQLANPAYGTKENPVPVFPVDLLKGKGELYVSNERENFHVSDTVYRIFVGQYLSRFMPKEEFKKMFRQKK